MKAGYVSFRHTVLVVNEAKLLCEAKCRNVYSKPSLLATSAELHPKGIGTITARFVKSIRLEIVATGLCSRNERTVVGVRIAHSNATSNLAVPLHKLYKLEMKKIK